MDLEIEVGAVREAVGLLWQRVFITAALAEGMRELLLEHKVLSADELDAKVAEIRKRTEAATLEAVRKSEAESEEQLLHYLAEHIEGPKQ